MTDDARIVPWQPGYGDAFARLNLEWIEKYFQVEELDRKYLDDPQGSILAAGGEIFYAVRGDVVVGTAAAIPMTPGVFELGKMAVVPSEQGRGLGRRLVDHVVRYARGIGAEALELMTNSGLAPALALYHSTGFVREPLPHGQVYERGDVYMRQRLVPQAPHAFSFFADTYTTERLKTLSTWATFRDDELELRVAPSGRTPHEQMVHQCVSEDTWFRTMLGIETGLPALPAVESRMEFLVHYARTSALRLVELGEKPEGWFREETGFFDVRRSRAWVLLRRIAHSAHHRGQLTQLLRGSGRELYSTYGPTADTGGLMQHKAPVIYPYGSVSELLESQRAGKMPSPLPGSAGNPVTERP